MQLTGKRRFSALVLCVAGLVSFAAGPQIPKERVRLKVEAEPQAVPGGEVVRVTVHLAPLAGIKLNRYPKIRLQTEAVAGVVEAATVELGNPAPPPPDALETNYFDPAPDPLKLKLEVAPGAKPGRYEVPARLRYFYCVSASGFCAPAEERFSIPITVR